MPRLGNGWHSLQLSTSIWQGNALSFRKFSVFSKCLYIIVSKVPSCRTQRPFCLAKKSSPFFFLFLLSLGLFFFQADKPVKAGNETETKQKDRHSYLQPAPDVMIMIIINNDFSQYNIFHHNWVLHELALIHINAVNVSQESCVVVVFQTFHARCVCNTLPTLKIVRYTMILLWIRW